MNQPTKTLVGLIALVLPILQVLMPALGYEPPLPLQRVFHASPEAIAAICVLLVSQITSMRHLVGDAWAMVTDYFGKRSAAANADYEQLQQDFQRLVRDQALLKAQYVQLAASGVGAAQPAPPIPPAQAGRSTLGALLMGLVLSIACIVPTQLLTGCAGMAAVSKPTDAIAYVEAALTASDLTATTMSDAGQITIAQAQAAKAASARGFAALTEARAASKAGDLTTLQGKLAAATQALTALQALLPQPK